MRFLPAGAADRAGLVSPAEGSRPQDRGVAAVSRPGTQSIPAVAATEIETNAHANLVTLRSEANAR